VPTVSPARRAGVSAAATSKCDGRRSYQINIPSQLRTLCHWLSV